MATAGPVALIALPLFAIRGFQEHWGTPPLLAVQSVLSLATALGLAHTLRRMLRQSRTLTVASHLPSADSEIAGDVWGLAALCALVIVYLNLLVYGCAARDMRLGWDRWMFVPVLATFQWLACIATATALLALFPRLPFVALGVGLIASVPVYFLANAPRQNTVVEACLLWLPTGWVNAVVFLAWWQQLPRHWWWLAASAVLCASLPFSLGRLKSMYRIREFVLAGPTVWAILTGPLECGLFHFPRLWAWLLPGIVSLPSDDREWLSPDEARERVLAGDYLENRDWHGAGWVERLAARWLTPREKTVIGFLTAEEFRWSLNPLEWLQLAGVILIFGATFGWPPGIWFLAGIGLVLRLVFQGPWPSFRTRPCGATHMSHWAIFPVGFDEACGAMLKAAAIRCVCAVPLLLMLALLGTAGQAAWPLLAVELALGASAGLFVCSVYQSLLLFNSGAEWSQRGWSIFFWGVLTVAMALALACGVVLMLFSLQRMPGVDGPLFCGGAAIVIAITVSAQRFVRRQIHSGALDFCGTKPGELDSLFGREEVGERSRRMSALVRKHGWTWLFGNEETL